MTATLVAFEGHDSSGKSKQSRMLVAALNAIGVPAVRVEPTKATHPLFQEVIYSMLRTGLARKYPNLFQFMYFSNKLYFQFFVLPDLMRDNQVVVLDRWALSGYVYGKATGIVPRLNTWMYRLLKVPHTTVVMTGKSYGHRDQVADVYEADDRLQQYVKHLYTLHAGPGCVLINNEATTLEVQAWLQELLYLRGSIPIAPTRLKYTTTELR